MAILDSKFQILKGYFETQDLATIGHALAGQVGYTPQEGDVVVIEDNAGTPVINVVTLARVENAASILALATLLVAAPHTWLVRTGMSTKEPDAVYAKKAAIVKGTMIIQTANVNAVDMAAIVPGDDVTVQAGIIRKQGYLGGVDMFIKYGELLAWDGTAGLATIAIGHL